MNTPQETNGGGLSDYIQTFGERLSNRAALRAVRAAVGILALAGTTLASVESRAFEAQDTTLEVSAPGCDMESAAAKIALPANFSAQEPAKARLEGKLQRVFTLPELGKRFPADFGNYEQQLNHINRLSQETSVDLCEYQSFIIDTSRNTAFIDQPGYHDRIRPELFLFHFTTLRYPEGVDGFVKDMKKDKNDIKRVAYFINHDAPRVYSLFEDDTHKPAHAVGMNLISQGVELEAINLFDVTPAMLKETIKLYLQFCLRNNLLPGEYTGIGHYAGDLIFLNPTFNAERRTVASLRRADMVQEIVAIILRESQKLYAQLQPAMK